MKKKNKCLLIAFILGLVYAIYIIAHFGGALSSAGDDAEVIGAGLATVMVMPHMICVVLATIFNGLGVFMNKRGFALTGAILYAVAMVLFIPYFFFVVIQMVLSFIGFAQLKKELSANNL